MSGSHRTSVRFPVSRVSRQGKPFSWTAPLETASSDPDLRSPYVLYGRRPSHRA